MKKVMLCLMAVTIALIPSVVGAVMITPSPATLASNTAIVPDKSVVAEVDFSTIFPEGYEFELRVVAPCCRPIIRRTF